MAPIDKNTLLELICKLGMGEDVDFLREGVKTLTQALMEAEISQQIQAERYERSDERVTQRNGYREREWDTRVGTMQLQIPKLRKGTYFPSIRTQTPRGESAAVRDTRSLCTWSKHSKSG